MSSPYFLLFVAVVLNVLAQLAVKSSALSAGGQSAAVGQIVSLARTPFFWAAIVLYGLSFLLYTLVLTKVEVSRAYPMSSISTILLLLILSISLFHEPMTISKAAGIGLSIGGIIFLFR